MRVGDHDAVEYIRHGNAQSRVWREIAGLPRPRVLGHSCYEPGSRDSQTRGYRLASIIGSLSLPNRFTYGRIKLRRNLCH